MADEYRFLIRKAGDGKYYSEATYNGKKVEGHTNFDNSLEQTLDSLSRIGKQVLSDNLGVNQFEFKISGEDLKQLKKRYPYHQWLDPRPAV